MGVRYREFLEAQRLGRTLFKSGSDRKKVFEVDLRSKEVVAKFNAIVKEIKDPNKRREAVKEGVSFVVAGARKRAPKSQKPHYLYTGVTKLISNIRASRGSVVDKRIKFYPGNLKLSIQHLERLRRTPDAIIGPKIVRNPRAKAYGRNERNTNAYYAQMVYGSAKAFRDRVMVPALLESESKVIAAVRRKAKEIIRTKAKRVGA